MINRILLPLDGSRFAESAAPLARRLARATDAELHLVLVQESLPAVSEETYQDLLDWSRKGEEEYVAEILTSVGGTRGVILRGDPVEVIAEYVTTHEMDLVVLSTHGWGAVKRFWLGSVADRLIRQVTVPLLLVRPDEDGSALADIDGFLVSLDNSGFGEAVLPVVVDLALTLDVEIQLVQVVQPALPMNGAIDGFTVPWDPKITKEMTVEAEAYLNSAAADLRGQGCRVTTRVLVGGLVADTILGEAKAGTEVIAMATHAEAGIRRLLIGSVADKVIRGSNSAVLVAHPS
jgi:nucleotide-binding universal stress UspA family protein